MQLGSRPGALPLLQPVVTLIPPALDYRALEYLLPTIRRYIVVLRIGVYFFLFVFLLCREPAFLWLLCDWWLQLPEIYRFKGARFSRWTGECVAEMLDILVSRFYYYYYYYCGLFNNEFFNIRSQKDCTIIKVWLILYKLFDAYIHSSNLIKKELIIKICFQKYIKHRIFNSQDKFPFTHKLHLV